MSKLKTLVRWGLPGLVVLSVIIQAVPHGRNHTNPPVRTEPTWDSRQTRALTVRACYDCHSNQTKWPWYASIAPISWLIQRDVDEGRTKLNFSEWNRPQEEPEEAAESVQEGEMPPWYYTLFQPKAKLSPAERQTLIQGLAATLGQAEHEEREDED